MEKKISKGELEKLVKIAKDKIPILKGRVDLEEQKSDDADFYDIAVWCLKDALIDAYELGKASAQERKQMGIYSETEERQALNRAYCPNCNDRKQCIHNEAYRRLPKECGGLGLCPRLKDDTDPKRVDPIQVTKVSGNWKIGTIDGIDFEAKVYEEDSKEYGINGGNVSKLWIKGIANYDRGWDVKPKTKPYKAMVERLVEFFSKEENKK